jgi:hypothetical protein
VAGGYDDVTFREHPCNFQARVLLRSQRNQPRQSIGSIQQSPHCGFVGLEDGIRRVRSPVTLRRVDEWSFDVKPAHDLPKRRDTRVQSNQALEPGFHRRQRIRDDGYQHPVNALTGKPRAHGVNTRRVKIVSIEVDPSVPVHLQIEESHQAFLIHLRFSTSYLQENLSCSEAIRRPIDCSELAPENPHHAGDSMSG